MDNPAGTPLMRARVHVCPVLARAANQTQAVAVVDRLSPRRSPGTAPSSRRRCARRASPSPSRVRPSPTRVDSAQKTQAAVPTKRSLMAR